MSSNLAPDSGHFDPRVLELVREIAERLQAEPDLDDFLAWTAGTLEYWIHIVASSVAGRHGWASRTEVPYITASPNAGSKSSTKWADGAMLLNDVGVLLEVKTIPSRDGVAGPTLRKAPQDFAAMAALDWKATLLQQPDQYSGIVWAERRAAMRHVNLLQLTLVHAPHGGLPHIGAVRATVRAAASSVCKRLEAQGLTSAASMVEHAFADEPAIWTLSGNSHEAQLYAWSALAHEQAED